MSKPVVSLVVEDDSDGKALRILADKLDLNIVLKHHPAKGKPEIVRRGDQLIILAKSDITDGNGCVAVLIDRDSESHEDRERNRAIERHCKNEGVPLLYTIEELEAWFLADEACAKWLDEKHRPNTDSISDPKQIVRRAYRKQTGKTYQERKAREILARQWNGSGPENSPSMQQALQHIKESPCGN